MNDIIDRLNKIAEFEDDSELNEIADELEGLKDNTILDVDNFKRELERAGLMMKELKDFIENYMRWDNN